MSIKTSIANLRSKIRTGEFTGMTSGFCPGYVQANLVILPQKYAEDFTTFCQSNPKPCPIIGVSKVGDYRLPSLGQTIDVRTDLPGYNIFINGSLDRSCSDILPLWRSDMVCFALGCSYSFEYALMEKGISIRNIEEGKNVSMYISSIQTISTAHFAAPMVVSMRPFHTKDLDQVIEITSRFPKAHGAPIHVGNPEEIGVADLQQTDFGNPVHLLNAEIPAFWACGVTPQVAIRNADLPFVITHVPGKMLITDRLYEDL